MVVLTKSLSSQTINKLLNQTDIRLEKGNKIIEKELAIKVLLITLEKQKKVHLKKCTFKRILKIQYIIYHQLLQSQRR